MLLWKRKEKEARDSEKNSSLSSVQNFLPIFGQLVIQQ